MKEGGFVGLEALQSLDAEKLKVWGVHGFEIRHGTIWNTAGRMLLEGDEWKFSYCRHADNIFICGSE